MKTMKLICVLLVVTFTVAFCQPDKTFTVPVRFPAGIYLGSETTLRTTWPTGTGSMVYPSVGIPISTGTAWGASIVNNSVQWNANTTWINTNGTNAVTAFSWGNHAGLYSLLNHNHSTLYRPLNWIPTFTEILAKPATYPATAHTHDYTTDIIGKPETIEMDIALSQLKGIKPHGYTTAQIDALVMTAAEEGMEVYDLTLHVKKYWNGTVWKIIPTTN